MPFLYRFCFFLLFLNQCRRMWGSYVFLSVSSANVYGAPICFLGWWRHACPRPFMPAQPSSVRPGSAQPGSAGQPSPAQSSPQPSPAQSSRIQLSSPQLSSLRLRSDRLTSPHSRSPQLTSPQPKTVLGHFARIIEPLVPSSRRPRQTNEHWQFIKHASFTKNMRGWPFCAK